MFSCTYPFMIAKYQYGFSPLPVQAHSVTWKRSGEYPKKTAAIPRVKYRNIRFLNASGFTQHSQLRLKECFCTFGGGPPNVTHGTDIAANRSAIHRTAIGNPWLSISLLTASGKTAPPISRSGFHFLRQKVRYLPPILAPVDVTPIAMYLCPGSHYVHQH